MCCSSTVCIFCFEELDDTNRSREHVIPEYLEGSFSVRDVCKSCNSRLGANSDHLALEDSRIISAALALDLPKLHASIRDRGTAKIVDVSDGSELPVTFKKGKPWIVPKPVTEQMFACDERDAPTHLRRFVREMKRDLGDEEVERSVGELKERYERLGPGESFSEPHLGLRLRRATGTIVPECKVTPGSCERLVSKIGYEMAFKTFDLDRLLSADVLQEIRAVAMGDGRLDEAIFMRPYVPPGAPVREPDYYHQILAWYGECGTFLDVYLFGCVDFRLYFTGDSPALYRPLPSPNGNIEMLGLALSFKPGEERRKHVAVKRAGEERAREWNVTGCI